MNEFSRETGSVRLRQLVVHFEDGLKQQIEAVYQELRSLFDVFLREKMQQLLEKHFKDFEDSMSTHLTAHPPKSLTDLKNQYFKVRDVMMKSFADQQIIKESHEREKLTAKLQEAMESRFSKWEAPLARHLAIEEAFNTAYAFFSADMSSCLDARWQTHKLMAEEVAEVLADCQQNALDLLDLELPEGVEGNTAADLGLQLRELTTADLDKYLGAYVHQESGFLDWIKSSTKMLTQLVAKQPVPLSPKSVEMQGIADPVSVGVTRGPSPSASTPDQATSRKQEHVSAFTAHMIAFDQQNPRASAAERLLEKQRVRQQLTRLMVQQQLSLDERRAIDRAIDSEWSRCSNNKRKRSRR